VAYDRALHDALPADVRASGVLRVATDASYAPASSFAPDGRTIVAFEPDLGAALGRVLGIKVRIVRTAFRAPGGARPPAALGWVRVHPRPWAVRDGAMTQCSINAAGQ
jgi:hypothetical protein